MSKLSTAILFLGASLAGPALADPSSVRPTAAERVTEPLLGAQQKAWFERAIEHILDETAHVAQASGLRR